ncbi:MAG: hypothetical protein GYB20_20145 [Oceanospirillales bacterium]|nr:hypothetical protein [Oceanospirillales bacterium]
MLRFLFSLSKRTILPLSLLAVLTSHGLTLFIPDYHTLLANTLSKMMPNIRSPWTEIDDLTRRNSSLKERNQKLTTSNKKLSIQNNELTASNKKMSRKLDAIADTPSKFNKFSKKLSTRIVRNIGINTSSALLESVPVYGTAIVIGVTAMDINDGCSTMNEMNELLVELDQEPDISGANRVCAYKKALPSRTDITQYWSQSIVSLKADTAARAQSLKQYTADTNVNLGGFIDHLVIDVKSKWTKFIRKVSELIFG